jgi:hypothetical protein
MIKFKQLVVGIMIGVILSSCIPVLAENGIKTISVLYNNIKITVNGKEIKTNVEPFQYNGNTFVPVRFVSEALGANVNWNDKTKTIEIIQPAIANTQPNKIMETQKPTIINSGFFNRDTSTLYSVYFSDGFMVSMSVPKGKLPNLLEYVIVSIYTEEMDKDITIDKPNFVGFSELTNQKYYPIDFAIYSENIPESLASDFKSKDFYENYKNYEPGDNIVGAVYYDSFPYLDGVYYDDGLHRCTLYLEDKER